MATHAGDEGSGEVRAVLRIRTLADALVVVAVLGMFFVLVKLNHAADVIVNGRQSNEITVRRMEDNPMQWSYSYESVSDGTVTVPTAQGVTPTGKLVAADFTVTSEETPEAAQERHRARIARAKELSPEAP